MSIASALVLAGLGGASYGGISLLVALILFGFAAFLAPAWLHWPRRVAAGLFCLVLGMLLGVGG